jgi:hypothetical protein
MPTEESVSADTLRLYQRGLARWENEGGSGAPAETARSEAPALNWPPLCCDVAESIADSQERTRNTQ